MARRLRGAAAIAGRAIAVAAAIIVLASLATGWLYWLRAGVSGWPGPRVADALPLDEMPGHDSVPLLIYLAVLGLAATALGLVARALRLDRLTAGLGLAAGTGGLATNRNLSLVFYPDALTKRAADILNKSEMIVFDASDMMPSAMNAAFWTACVNYVADPSSLDTILANLDKVRATAYKK